jgi:hypothetical protein
MQDPATIAEFEPGQLLFFKKGLMPLKSRAYPRITSRCIRLRERNFSRFETEIPK